MLRKMNFHRWKRAHPQRAERETRINLRPSKPALQAKLLRRKTRRSPQGCVRSQRKRILRNIRL